MVCALKSAAVILVKKKTTTDAVPAGVGSGMKMGYQFLGKV